MNGKRKERNEELGREIAKYGADVMASPLFRRGFLQTHHKITTVGDHTLNVAIAGGRITEMLSYFGIQADKKDVILGALLHDLGIIGRDEKFQNDHECGQKHAADSVIEAKRLLPGLTERQQDIIENHMFPVTRKAPRSREGRIVVTADKWCAVIEWIFFLLRIEPYHQVKDVIRNFDPTAVL